MCAAAEWAYPDPGAALQTAQSTAPARSPAGWDPAVNNNNNNNNNQDDHVYHGIDTSLSYINANT